jgi:hypothetical protein
MWQFIFSAVIVKGFDQHCLSHKIDGRKAGEEAGNIASEHDSMSSECETEDGNYKDTEVETDDWNGKQRKTGDTE